jgi:uncharacterized membrane protein YuzA (DUF378 family)
MTAEAPAAPDLAPALAPRGRPAGRHPGWPLTALLVLYPLWWALGMGTLIVFVLAAVMALQLSRRRVLVPPGFGLWLLYLLCTVASMAMLNYNPPGTLAQTVVHRLPTVVYNLVGLLSVTVVLLYAGNLTEQEFPRRRLVRQLGFFFVVVVAGGFLGIVAPRFQFRSPVELLLPSNVASDVFVRSLVHPAASQLQEVFGYLTPRPAAPFGFTNTWGYCIALLMGWFVVSRFSGSRKGRVVGVVVLLLSAVPIVYSLNRGLWVGLGVAAVFMTFRLVARGNLAAIAALLAVLIGAAAVFAASPLGAVVEERLAHGQSNAIRTFTTVKTLEAVGHSPVLGLGATRAALGSANSIAVGAKAGCPRCGNPTLGSNGALWSVLITNGWLGLALYVGFFLRSLWAFRRDRSPIGDAGLLAIFLSLWFMFVYNALVMPLVFVFLSIALLWRNQREAAAAALEADTVARGAAGPGAPLVPRPGAALGYRR